MDKRDQVVNFRVTAEQKKQITALAKKGGVSVGDLIIGAVLDGKGVPMATVRANPPDGVMIGKGPRDLGKAASAALAELNSVKGEPTEKRLPPRAALPNWNHVPSTEPPANDVLDAIRANVWLDPLGKGNVCYDCKVGEGEKHKGSCGYAARMAANTN